MTTVVAPEVTGIEHLDFEVQCCGDACSNRAMWLLLHRHCCDAQFALCDRHLGELRAVTAGMDFLVCMRTRLEYATFDEAFQVRPL